MAMTAVTDELYSRPSGITPREKLFSAKRNFERNSKKRCFLYVFAHEHLAKQPSTKIFIGLANKAGRFIGEKGLVKTPLGRGFRCFRKRALELSFQKQMKKYFDQASDVGILVSRYPLDLYADNPGEKITQCILLRFPDIKQNTARYMRTLSSIIYGINCERNALVHIRKAVQSRKSIIDCSTQCVEMPENEFTAAYMGGLRDSLQGSRQRLMALAALHDRADAGVGRVQASEADVSSDARSTTSPELRPEGRNLSSNVENAGETTTLQGKRTEEAVPADDSRPTDGRRALFPTYDRARSNMNRADTKPRRSIKKRAAGFGAVIAALAGIAQLLGVDVLQIILWFLG